jgi:hypothetical protein
MTSGRRILPAEYRCNVGMIQRRQNAGFTLESRHTFAVVTESLRKKLDGNTAAQLGVGSLIDLSHAARTQMAGDLVMYEIGADHDVMKICGRILSNTTQVIHVFAGCSKEWERGHSWRITAATNHCEVFCTSAGVQLP